jgi:ParB/RepB/Spo0J family partition protein
MTTAVDVHGCLEILPVASIRPSKTNPRRAEDTPRFDELVSSVRAHGVLQPVLVRVIDNPVGTIAYELVCGHRRFAAARKVGMVELPAVVRVLDDRAALEVQMIENLQRADLHPLEEAEGYRRLHEEHAYSIDDLSAKLGKSKAYVYGRMKLTALSAEPRKAFLAGQLEASVALLIARIPVPKLQAQATKEVLNAEWIGHGDDDDLYDSRDTGRGLPRAPLHAAARRRSIRRRRRHAGQGRRTLRRLSQAHRQPARVVRRREECRRLHGSSLLRTQAGRGLGAATGCRGRGWTTGDRGQGGRQDLSLR